MTSTVLTYSNPLQEYIQCLHHQLLILHQTAESILLRATWNHWLKVVATWLNTSCQHP